MCLYATQPRKIIAMKKTDSNNKRPIDKLRDGSGAFDINTPGDESAISGMNSIDDERLLLIKGKGIYEIELADQIDPKRTNMNTPSTIQKVLPYGSDDPWVGSVLLTATELLKKPMIGEEVDCGKILNMVLRISQDIAGALEVSESYSKKEQRALENFDSKIRVDRSVILPAINDAQLPATYVRAITALSECSSLDECKSWADKSAALASYARQSKDDSMRKMAERIQARAIRRAGELLKQIMPKQGARTDLELRDGDDPMSRKQAADDAGLSERQRKN
jgi:hypothetical protein